MPIFSIDENRGRQRSCRNDDVNNETTLEVSASIEPGLVSKLPFIPPQLSEGPPSKELRLPSRETPDDVLGVSGRRRLALRICRCASPRRTTTRPRILINTVTVYPWGLDGVLENHTNLPPASSGLRLSSCLLRARSLLRSGCPSPQRTGCGQIRKGWTGCKRAAGHLQDA